MSNRRSNNARRSNRIVLAGNIVIAMVPTLMLLYFMVVYDWWGNLGFWVVAPLTAVLAWFTPPMARALGNKGCLIMLLVFVTPQLVAAYIPWLKPYVGVYFVVFFTAGAWRVIYDVFVKRVRIY